MRSRALAMALVTAVIAVSVGTGTAWSQDDTTTTSSSTTTSSTTSTTSSTTTTSTTAPPTTTTTVAAPAPKARGVGDSVFLSAENEVTSRLRPEYKPWFTAKLGASINELQDAAENMVTKDPAVFVIGMGNPDVENMAPGLGRRIVRMWALDMLDATESVPCVLWVNLKQRGVNPYYSQTWQRDATWFNNFLINQAAARANFHVIDWNTATTQHPGWFLADGLHLNQSGQNGYAAKIERVVSRVCAEG